MVSTISTFLVRRKQDGTVWKVYEYPDGRIFLTPNDGRVPSGQWIYRDTLDTLFDKIED